MTKRQTRPGAEHSQEAQGRAGFQVHTVLQSQTDKHLPQTLVLHRALPHLRSLGHRPMLFSGLGEALHITYGLLSREIRI
jgi:hypothetical protein